MGGKAKEGPGQWVEKERNARTVGGKREQRPYNGWRKKATPGQWVEKESNVPTKGGERKQRLDNGWRKKATSAQKVEKESNALTMGISFRRTAPSASSRRRICSSVSLTGRRRWCAPAARPADRSPPKCKHRAELRCNVWMSNVLMRIQGS